MAEETRHEERDIRPKVVLVFAGALAALSMLTLLSMGWLWRVSRAPEVSIPAMLRQPERLRPGPRLQVSPAKDLQEMRAVEERRLHSYRWIDLEAGIVSVPIERAMEILAERGLPVHRGKPSQAGGEQ